MPAKKKEEAVEAEEYGTAPKVPETHGLEGKAVYASLANVLKSLSVEKNGTLPSNMGGKNYITASDAANEVKRQFVANNLIFVPNETIIKHETIIFKERLNVLIAITGTYEIISTVDGSSVTVSGTGDGLATGTAVASNIASTNAFKNALLRTFLITEQSAEDAAKEGDQAPEVKKASAAQRKVDSARPKTRTASEETPGSDKEKIDALTAKIRKAIDNGEVDRDTVNTTRDALKEEGKSGVALFTALVKTLEI